MPPIRVLGPPTSILLAKHLRWAKINGDTVTGTLVVDDEPIARQVLRDELAAFGDVAIMGEGENSMGAVDLIHWLGPDLVFLDLQMPQLVGIELIGRVSVRYVPAIRERM
jgi:DNA-binding NarL/FixJ family response regulator